MRVLVYEPTATGHHFAYLSHVMPTLAELASELVLVTTPSAASASQFQLHLGQFAKLFTLYTEIRDKPSGTTLRDTLREWSVLRRCVKELQPDHVYVAYGDRLATVAGFTTPKQRRWPRELESEVLLLRGGYRYSVSGPLRRVRQMIMPRLVVRGPWTVVHHINPDDFEVLRDLSRDSQRCRLMPDPVEPAPQIGKAQARRELGIAETGRYLGCAGSIDRRKGIDLLLRAFAAARPRLGETDRLLLAGPVQPQIRELIQQEWSEDVASGRIVILDQPLTGTEIGLALVAMDLVCTPYPKHPHSASIVIRAAAAERPVLGCSIGWMERTIARFGLGTTCNVLDLNVFAQAIVNNLERSNEFSLNEAARRFVEFHAPWNFATHWVARLRERRGIAADKAPLAWDWVLEALPGGA